MKICGIICEYNPFHNGHKSQIDYIKKELGYDFVIIAMSGNFSQRATPSILDKYSRSKMVCGADLIVQIPTAYSINNGEIFATAGIKVLNALGVNSICFGVETLNKDLFLELADNMLNESSLYKQNLNKELKKGNSFKSANITALKNSFANGEQYAELLSKPNNILALEYIKVIKKYNYNIGTIFLKREDNFSLTFNNSPRMSATQIRYNLSLKNWDIDVPKSSLDILKTCYNENYISNFKKIMFDILLNIDIDILKETYLVSEGIENRIFNAICTSKNYDELISKISTKRYDVNKINRILLNYVLGVNKNTIMWLYNNEFNYLKVLSFNADILNFVPVDKLIIRKNDVSKFTCENDFLQKIENKSNLIANNIFNINLPYKDIFIKPNLIVK